MAIVTINRPHNLRVLSGQLFAAFPGWVSPGPYGIPSTTAKVYGNGATVTVEFPAPTTIAQVTAIIAAHVAVVDPPPVNPWTALNAELLTVTTIAALRTALSNLATRHGG